jgi:hypothetical protein
MTFVKKLEGSFSVTLYKHKKWILNSRCFRRSLRSFCTLCRPQVPMVVTFFIQFPVYDFTQAPFNHCIGRFEVYFDPKHKVSKISWTRSQSYDFFIYNYNESVVVGLERFFQIWGKYLFYFQNALGYSRWCVILQRCRCNSRSQEPILRLFNLQLQRQRRRRQERFFQIRRNYFCFQNALATHDDVKFYSAGVVTRDRRIGSRDRCYDF